jgi:signal transduction histidine kinase
MNVGADDYLTKPFEVDELLAAITTRLEKHAVVKKQTAQLRINLSSILPREIWTPLADITAFSEFLTHETLLSTPHEVVAIGSIIHDTSLHLQHLVENYLMYAQLKLIECDPDGRDHWPPDEEVATKKFLTFLAENQAECINRRDDLVLDLIDISIHIAPRSLQEIMTELLDNAFKFSEPGTHIHLVSYSDGGQFVLRITDHGQGMTPEAVTSIEACEHVKHPWDDQQEPGFGLRICRLLVRLHGGTLAITSAPNKGTTVTIQFDR